MARHLCFAITLTGMAMLLYSPARAVIDAPRCENNAANVWADAPIPVRGQMTTNVCFPATSG
jgi:hypothetical protein